MPRRLSVLLLVGVVIALSGLRAPSLRAADGSRAQEIILPNGFRILVVEDPQSPRVAASLFYRVRYGGHRLSDAEAQAIENRLDALDGFLAQQNVAEAGGSNAPAS